VRKVRVTIRQSDDFPDVDELLTEAAQKRWAAVLEYRERAADRAERRGLAPGVRQGLFAVALAAFFGGWAFVFARYDSQAIGAAFVTIGAFVLGFILPIPGTRRRGGGFR
jgi:hypothetical protein